MYLFNTQTYTDNSEWQTGKQAMGKCGEMVGKAEETGGGADASRRKLNDCAHEVTQHSNAHFTPFSKVCLRRYHAEAQAHTAEEASFSSFHPAFLRISPQISSAFPVELPRRRRRRRVCVMRLSTTAGVMEMCVILA